MSINTVAISGNVTADPEVKYTASGTAITTFSVAVTRAHKDKQTNEWKNEVSYIEVKAFGQLAEKIIRRYSKGNGVVVSGEIRQERWETQEGAKRSRVVVMANKVEDAEWQPRENSQPAKPQYQQPQAQRQQPMQPRQQDDRPFPEVEIEDEQIPF